LPDPRTLVRQLLAHRQMREGTILKAIQSQDWTVAELAEHLYHKTDFRLKIAAQRNVLAHLLKLEHEGKVVQAPMDEPDPPPDEHEPDDLPPGDDKAWGKSDIDMIRRDAERRFFVAT
jgi:hypothetical protein